jgi:hypothetical protein
MVTLRHAKSGRIRLVPLHPSVTAALRAYAATRDRLCPTPRVDRFFVSVTGRALRRGEADQVFRVITGLMGIRAGTVRPRIHDYADVSVMPTSARSPCSEAVKAQKFSA